MEFNKKQHDTHTLSRNFHNEDAASNLEEAASSLLDHLYSIVNILNSQSGQQQMLKEVLNVLEEKVDLRRTTLMLLSPDERELHLEAAKDVQHSDKQMLRYQRGEGITGRVLQYGQPAIIPRISHEPEFRSRIHNRDHEKVDELSFICVPIKVDQEVVGTLSADLWKQSESQLVEIQKLLSVVANMIAFDVKARRTASIERQAMESEHLRLRSALGERFRPENILGNSNTMRKVYERIHQVSNSETTVLIRGESGTGKELVASAIHYSSDRANKPFIRVNCSALSEHLIESELFGHEKGAFTGAIQTRRGRLEEAEGGTLFLDEIGDFSISTQIKLLRVLQEREFQRVGSNQTIKADVRILAATNRDLEEEIQATRFRQDFFYRINVFPIYLPPLRDRKDDILLLADFFAKKYGTQMNKRIERISTTAINMMIAYHWPGNVRELENCIEHAVVLSHEGVIHGHNLPPTLQMPSISKHPLEGNFNQRIQQIETDMIVDALKATHGNIAAAARHLELTPRIIRYKMDKYNIALNQYEK